LKSCPSCQRTYPDDIEFCPHDATRLTTAVIEAEAQLAAGLARRFRIVRRLGSGGMGTVFLAEQIGVGNRPVALKVLNRKLLDDPEFLLRFQNEAGSTGRITHPNVVTIYESGQGDDGTPYIAMQFLEGESLRETLQTRGALPLAECAEILQQTARGLNAAHKLGIIHRDLKPDNIFLAQGDEGQPMVKVVDFGIAKLRESAIHTTTGMVLGTPAYMSYEQAYGMRSEQLDARSDIYSLGIVVYEMLTGRLPFHSDTPQGFLRKHIMDPPPPFRATAPGLPVPPEVEAVVMKALAKDREQRYASTLEFARNFSRAASAQVPSELLPPTVIVPVRPDVTPTGQEKERAEAERLAKEEAEAERAAREKAEQERLAREKAEATRAAREKAEAERLAQEKAGAERRAKESTAAVATVAPRITTLPAPKSNVALWGGVIVGVLLLGVVGGYVYFSTHRSSVLPTPPPAVATNPSTNPSPVKPQAAPEKPRTTPGNQVEGLWKESSTNGGTVGIFDSPVSFGNTMVTLLITPTGKTIVGEWHEWRQGIDSDDKTKFSDEFKATFAMRREGRRLMGRADSRQFRGNNGSWSLTQGTFPITCTLATDEMSCLVVWEKGADESEPKHLRRQ
jgi:serine/threonine-protein kinase